MTGEDIEYYIREFNLIHGSCNIHEIRNGFHGFHGAPIIVLEANDLSYVQPYEKLKCLQVWLDKLNAGSEQKKALNEILNNLGKGHYVYYYPKTGVYTICDRLKITILK